MLGEAVRKAEAWRCQAPSHHFLSPAASLDEGLARSCELRPWKMRSCSLLSTLGPKGRLQATSKQSRVCFHELRCLFLSGFPNVSQHHLFQSFPKNTHVLPRISPLSSTIELGHLDCIPDLSFCVFPRSCSDQDFTGKVERDGNT